MTRMSCCDDKGLLVACEERGNAFVAIIPIADLEMSKLASSLGRVTEHDISRAARTLPAPLVLVRYWFVSDTVNRSYDEPRGARTSTSTVRVAAASSAKTVLVPYSYNGTGTLLNTVLVLVLVFWFFSYSYYEVQYCSQLQRPPAVMASCRILTVDTSSSSVLDSRFEIVANVDRKSRMEARSAHLYLLLYYSRC